MKALPGEEWPPWAVGSSAALGSCLALLHLLDRYQRRPPSVAVGTSARPASRENGGSDAAFGAFQWQYLLVYYLVMFADWLQGTHMYSLYESYGVNVSTLFLTGFLSSAVFGNLVGPIVDKFGRKRACLVFCVLEIIINVLENVPDMTILLLGRVLGGISTSLLFTAFESWMVTEHRSRGFDDHLLSKTFALASEGNGILAVVAGVVAQLAADTFGEIGPFRLAVIITFVALLSILPWEENYGSTPRGSTAEKKSESSTMKQAPQSKKWTPAVSALGLCYSLFDGAMYVFVFLWYPTLSRIAPGPTFPSGLVFSCFMFCIAIGGKLYDAFGNAVGEEQLAIFLCGTSAAAFLIPRLTSSFELVFASFLLFEVCVGMFSPCCATLRSRHFPDQRLSTILSIFRFPTNALVVLGAGGSNYLSRSQLFQFCSVVMSVSTLCGLRLLQVQQQRKKDKNA